MSIVVDGAQLGRKRAGGPEPTFPGPEPARESEMKCEGVPAHVIVQPQDANVGHQKVGRYLGHQSLGGR
jgi:hypothetical protein